MNSLILKGITSSVKSKISSGMNSLKEVIDGKDSNT